MQTLVLADDLFPLVEVGRRKNTIRAGSRDIRPGHLEFRSVSGEIDPLRVEVTEVTVKDAADVDQRELYSSGFEDLLHMLWGLKRSNPDFCEDSQVTVITWA